MRRIRILTAMSLTVLMVTFQNCGSQVDFQEAKFSLAAVGLNGDEKLTGDENAPIENTPADEDVANLPSEDKPIERPDDGDVKQPKNSKPPKSSGGDYKVCILKGSGKSLKLGLVESDLAGVNAVSSAICITEKACLEIVSKAFEVEGSYSRGYCAHNPHVQRLTDEEVQALL